MGDDEVSEKVTVRGFVEIRNRCGPVSRSSTGIARLKDTPPHTVPSGDTTSYAPRRLPASSDMGDGGRIIAKVRLKPDATYGGEHGSYEPKRVISGVPRTVRAISSRLISDVVAMPCTLSLNSSTLLAQRMASS